MLRTSRLLLLPLLLTLAPLGCSDDPAAPTVRPGESAGGTSAAGGAGGAGGDPGTAGTAGTGGTVDPGGKAGGTAYPIPEEGYGLNEGNVIRNITFQGLRTPKGDNFDAAAVETISLSDYYNPTGDTSRPRVLVLTAAARWCVPCQEEAKGSMANWKYWQPRGAEFLSAVTQDDKYEASTFEDMTIWSKTYQLEYPTVIDPSPPQLGAYFAADAFPFNLVVDLRTMKILKKIAGSISFNKSNAVLNKALPE